MKTDERKVFQIHALKECSRNCKSRYDESPWGKSLFSDPGRSVWSIEGSIAEAIDSTFQS